MLFFHTSIFNHPNHFSISCLCCDKIRSSTNTQSWLEEEEASIASSSYSKKQPNYAQKPMQQPSSVPQHPQPQQTNMVKPPLPSTFDTQSQHNHNHQQQQHSPGSTAQPPQQSPDEKSLYGENDGANLENNETKSVSSLRSGASLPERLPILNTFYLLFCFFLSFI